MYEKLKVGTVIEFKDTERQEIFVGYENPFVLVFYDYSPDMLKTFDLAKQTRYIIGFEEVEPFKLKKQLDEKRLKAWYLKNRMLNKQLPALYDSGLDSVKRIKEFKELEVFDMFLVDTVLYAYLGNTFDDDYICYYLGSVSDKADVLLLRNCALRSDRLRVVREKDIEKSSGFLYFVQHLTEEQIKGMQGLRYGDLLFGKR